MPRHAAERAPRQVDLPPLPKASKEKPAFSAKDAARLSASTPKAERRDDSKHEASLAKLRGMTESARVRAKTEKESLPKAERALIDTQLKSIEKNQKVVEALETKIHAIDKDHSLSEKKRVEKSRPDRKMRSTYLASIENTSKELLKKYRSQLDAGLVADLEKNMLPEGSNDEVEWKFTTSEKTMAKAKKDLEETTMAGEPMEFDVPEMRKGELSFYKERVQEEKEREAEDAKRAVKVAAERAKKMAKKTPEKKKKKTFEDEELDVTVVDDAEGRAKFMKREDVEQEKKTFTAAQAEKEKAKAAHEEKRKTYIERQNARDIEIKNEYLKKRQALGDEVRRDVKALNKSDPGDIKHGVVPELAIMKELGLEDDDENPRTFADVKREFSPAQWEKFMAAEPPKGLFGKLKSLFGGTERQNMWDAIQEAKKNKKR